MKRAPWLLLAAVLVIMSPGPAEARLIGGTHLNQQFFVNDALQRLTQMKRDPSGQLASPVAMSRLSRQEIRQLWAQRVPVLHSTPRFLALSSLRGGAIGVKPTQLSLATSSASPTIVESSYIAYGTDEQSPYLFTWVYTFDYEANTGALVRYGMRIATAAEARAAGLPVNNLPAGRTK
jgi:hypothetical protein